VLKVFLEKKKKKTVRANKKPPIDKWGDISEMCVCFSSCLNCHPSRQKIPNVPLTDLEILLGAVDRFRERWLAFSGGLQMRVLGVKL
jgi:hypothetical protein